MSAPLSGDRSETYCGTVSSGGQGSVAVIGAGSWGTTVAALLGANADVRLWCRREELAEAINGTHRNEAYLGGVELPVSLRATTDIARAVDGADVVVMGVPSVGFRETARLVAPSVGAGVPVVSLAKGLEAGSLLRMTEVAEAELPGHPVAVLTGPNLAIEIAQGQPAASVVGCADESVARRLQSLFGTPTLRVYTNTDVVGCEIAGVVKNVIAIATGMAAGMGFGDNTRATLITRGLAEISRLAMAMGGSARTLAGLAGMGDLIATCSSTKSRNNTVGVRLGRGEKIDDIVASTSMVAEGVRSSLFVLELAGRYGVEMPITDQVAAVCHRGVPIADALRALMERGSTSEFR